MAATKPRKKKASEAASAAGSVQSGDVKQPAENAMAGKKGRVINTGGGVYIEGGVTTGGGDFVGRDKIDQSVTVGDITGSTGVAIGAGARAAVEPADAAPLAAEELAAVFGLLERLAAGLPEGPARENAQDALKKLITEMQKGSAADEARLQRYLNLLRDSAPSVYGAALAALHRPPS